MGAHHGGAAASRPHSALSTPRCRKLDPKVGAAKGSRPELSIRPSRDLEENDEVCTTPRFEMVSVASTSAVAARHRQLSPSRKVSRMASALLDAAENPEVAQGVAEAMFLDSLPAENVQSLTVVPLQNDASKERFLNLIRFDGSEFSRVRFAWHLAGSSAAAQSIETEGIRCDDGHCSCGRYGRGGYVATSAAKAHAYSDSDGNGGERHLFLVLILPEEELIKGERGTRPKSTAADLPSHPTEYCFVNPARLHCVCRLDYSWVPTGRRPKVATAGGHCRAWRSQLQRQPSPVRSPRRAPTGERHE